MPCISILFTCDISCISNGSQHPHKEAIDKKRKKSQSITKMHVLFVCLQKCRKLVEVYQPFSRPLYFVFELMKEPWAEGFKVKGNDRCYSYYHALCQLFFYYPRQGWSISFGFESLAFIHGKLPGVFIKKQ
jgi:hypothetical protein